MVGEPPPLPWAVRTALERWILIVSLLGSLGIGLVLFLHRVGFSWGCTWKSLTGFPCAGCGGTRALSALLAGDVSTAITLNPGVVMTIAALVVASMYAVAVLLFRFEPWRPNVPHWRWWVFVALLINWIYLLQVGLA